MAKAKPEPVTEMDVADWVYAKFDPSGDSFPSYKALADRFERKSAEVIARHIFRAFKEGRFVIQETELARFSRNIHLEREVRDRFPHLRSAIVIDGPERSDLPTGGRYGDALHEMLGDAMAEFMYGNRDTLFRDGDLCGIGSGRGVFQTVDALRRFGDHIFPAENVKLVSMTGHAGVEHHAARQTLLDADQILPQFGLCFSPGVEFHLVQSAIALREREKKGRKWYWTTDVQVDHLLAGIGVLGPGHRFHEATRHGKPIEPIEGPLEKLVDASEEAGKKVPGYFPVADICNRLFFVPPPSSAEGVLKPADLEFMRREVDRVNRYLVTPSLEDLSKINSIMIVAGTEAKAGATRQILEDDNLRIRVLCTDSRAAERLLS